MLDKDLEGGAGSFPQVYPWKLTPESELLRDFATQVHRLRFIGGGGVTYDC